MTDDEINKVSHQVTHLTDLSNCFRSERVPVYNPGLGWEAAKYPLRAVFSLIFSLCLGCISKRGNSYIFWEPHFLNLIRSLTDICRKMREKWPLLLKIWTQLDVMAILICILGKAFKISLEWRSVNKIYHLIFQSCFNSIKVFMS